MPPSPTLPVPAIGTPPTPHLPAIGTPPILPVHAIGTHSLLPVHAFGTPPRSSDLVAFLTGEGEPSWAASLNWYLFGHYFNFLLVFLPLSAVAHHLNWDVTLRFFFSVLAIMPLARLLDDSTEQISAKLGPTPAGLLNASFGNAVELIFGIVALLQDQVRIVQTSMLGSILSNLLLVLGCTFLAAGFKFHESSFRVTAAQISSSFMILACITLVIPAAYYFTNTTSTGVPNKQGLLVISRGTAIALLLVYIAFLYFQLKSHRHFYVSEPQRDKKEEEEEEEEEEETTQMSAIAASISLLLVTVVTFFWTGYLVASIEEFAERYHFPKAFVGLILLSVVAKGAEHVTSIWLPIKGQMELTITICLGGSIQIATFVVPLLVIIGWISGHELTLFFANFDTIVLFVSVFLVNNIVQNGKSNYMEGLMLVLLYFVISLAIWMS